MRIFLEGKACAGSGGSWRGKREYGPLRVLAGATLGLLGTMVLAPVGSALALDLTPDPKAWRPLVETDLGLPGPEARIYAGIWSDILALNNERLRKAGVSSRLIGNLGARERHVTVRNEQRTVVLTILEAPGVCTRKPGPNLAGRTLMDCPLRLVLFEGERTTIREGVGCALSFEASAARPSGDRRDGTYASYDIATKSIRLGLLIGGIAREECAKIVPIEGLAP